MSRVLETSQALVNKGLMFGAGVLALSIIIGLLAVKLIVGGLTRRIMNVVMDLDDISHGINNGSREISDSSHNISAGAENQAASLEETAAALEEISSMTKKTLENSHDADQGAKETKNLVESGVEDMKAMNLAMAEIEDSASKINNIIKAIEEIAFQTNLLALNASVEAARAGEAGAGFAVVADEVRNLAIRSADAAKNTADLIASTIANISSGSEMVNATAENFKTVESHSNKVAELLAKVSEASKEQSQGIGQITTAMTEMDKVTQSNAASAEESASAAGQLSLQAGTLLEAVDGLDALVYGASRGAASHGASAAKPAVNYNRPSAPKTSGTVKPAKALPQTQKRYDDFDMDDDFGF